MEAFVWVAAWEQQCCGDPFAVGSAVTWPVAQHHGPDEWVELLLGRPWGERVGYAMSRHDEPDRTLSGVARDLLEVRCRRRLRPEGGRQVLAPVRESGWLTPVAEAGAWIPDPPEDSRGPATFDGWIVGLTTG